MKEVQYSWTEYRTIIVPDHCPTGSLEAMFKWINNKSYDGGFTGKEDVDYEFPLGRVRITSSEEGDWNIDQVKKNVE